MKGDNTKLFKIKDEPMRFHLIHLTPDELLKYKTLIEHAGGTMASDSEETFVKFTTKKSYPVDPIYALAAIYNVRFILKCIEEQTLVDPAPYRLKESNASRDACGMNHFLFGCSACPRHTPCTEERQGSTVVARSESRTNDNFSSPLELGGETPEFVSAENSSLSSASVRIVGNETMLERDFVAPLHPVDESQPVVANRDIEKSISEMAGGDRATTSDVINDRNEKRPCSLEYQLEVLPKMELIAEQQRTLKIANEQKKNLVNNPITNLLTSEATNHRHQRSPRTISKRRRIIDRTPEKDFPIKVENTTIMEETENVEIVENTRLTVDKTDTRSLISSPVEILPKTEQLTPSASLSYPKSATKKLGRDTDDAENTMSTENMKNTRNSGCESDPSSMMSTSMEICLNPYSYIADPQSSSDSEVPKKKSRYLTVIAEARQRPSPSYVLNRPTRKENWITTENGKKVTSPNQDFQFAQLIRNPLYKGSSDSTNIHERLVCSSDAESDTSRTELSLNPRKDGNRRGVNCPNDNEQEILNISESRKRSRQSRIEKNCEKRIRRASKSSDEANIVERVKRTKNLPKKTSTVRNISISDSSDIESIDEDVACSKKSKRITNDDSSWNKAGPSGLTNGQKKSKYSEHESGKENGETITENGRISKNDDRSSRTQDDAGVLKKHHKSNRNTKNDARLDKLRSEKFIMTSDSDTDGEQSNDDDEESNDETEYPNRHKSTKSQLGEKSAGTDRWNVPTHRRTLFNATERKIIIKYLIENDAIGHAKGHTIWKQMIAEGILSHRTYQSLHNHFKKHILPRIEDASKMMDKKTLKQFLDLRKKTK